MQENLRLCLLAAASRYPESQVTVDEAVLTQYPFSYPFWRTARSPTQVVNILEILIPELLETPALLRVDTQHSALFLLEPEETRLFWLTRSDSLEKERHKRQHCISLE